MIASLLNPDSPFFAFDHDRMHRQMTATLPAGTTVTPMLDPPSDLGVSAGYWNSRHSRAHSDFAASVPRIYWASVVSLNDVNLSQERDALWTLSNWHLHNLTETALPPTG